MMYMDFIHGYKIFRTHLHILYAAVDRSENFAEQFTNQNFFHQIDMMVMWGYVSTNAVILNLIGGSLRFNILQDRYACLIDQNIQICGGFRFNSFRSVVSD